MTKEKKTEIKVFSYMTVQVILFVLYYGFNIKLPLWVLWFPIILILMIIIFFISLFILSFILEY